MKIVNPKAVIGEDRATKYLKEHKYKILERNYRKSYGEIDIIAIDYSEKEPVLAFIEVKTRSNKVFGTGFEAITYFKLKSLLKTAEFYKATHNNLPALLRIDGISIMLDSKNTVTEIALMKNIS